MNKYQTTDLYYSLEQRCALGSKKADITRLEDYMGK